MDEYGDNEFFITHASPMKDAVSSTGAIFKSAIRFGSGETAQTIVKIFISKHPEMEFEITEEAYRGTDVKLYYTAFASTNINVFISDQLDDLCASNMNTHHYKILKRTMKSIGRGSNHILSNSYMGSKQGFGIMIMTNIHSFGKLYRHSYVSGRYPRTKILKEKKYMQRWQFNGLHQMLSLHKKGIVHGDLNFGNVWILEKPASKKKSDVGKVFIIDFGESFEKKDASIIDELRQLPQSTSEEQSYLRNSLPWKLQIFMREMNKTLKNKYLKVYPKDEEQLNYELSLINDEGHKKNLPQETESQNKLYEKVQEEYEESEEKEQGTRITKAQQQHFDEWWEKYCTIQVSPKIFVIKVELRRKAKNSYNNKCVGQLMGMTDFNEAVKRKMGKDYKEQRRHDRKMGFNNIYFNSGD